MAKKTTPATPAAHAPAPVWRRVQMSVTGREIIWYARRSDEAAPPSAHAAIIEQHLAAWRASDPDYLAWQALRVREEQAANELAAAERQLTAARENVSVVLVTTADPLDAAESRVSDAETTIEKLTSRLVIIRRQLRVASLAAKQSRHRLKESTTQQEMDVAKPALADVIAEIEQVTGPLYDRLVLATRNVDYVGQHWPTDESEFGPELPSGLAPEPQRHPGEPLKIIANNIWPDSLKTPSAPAASTRLPDPVFPGATFGNAGRKFYD